MAEIRTFPSTNLTARPVLTSTAPSPTMNGTTRMTTRTVPNSGAKTPTTTVPPPRREMPPPRITIRRSSLMAARPTRSRSTATAMLTTRATVRPATVPRLTVVKPRSAHLRTLPLGRRLPRTPLTITTSGLSSTTVRTKTPGGASPTTLSLPSLTTTSTTSAPSVPTTTSGLRTSATTRPVRLMPTAAPLPLRPPLVTTTAARDTARMLTTLPLLKTRVLKSGARPRTNGMPMVGIRTSKRPSPSTPLKPRPTMPSPTMSGTTKMPTNGVPRSGAATKMSMDNLPTARRPPLISGPATTTVKATVKVVTPMSPRTGRVPPEVTLHLAVNPMTPNGPTRSTALIPTPGGASLTTPSLPGLTTAPSTAGPSMLRMISGLRTTTATPMTILRLTAPLLPSGPKSRSTVTVATVARALTTLPPGRVPRACATRTVTITAPTAAIRT